MRRGSGGRSPRRTPGTTEWNSLAKFTRVLLVCVALAPGVARSERIIENPIDGASLAVPTDSDGIGFADLHYRPKTLDLWVHYFLWMDLSSPVTVGHVHCCGPAGEASPVAFHLVGISQATSGSFAYTWDLTLESSFDPAFLAAHGGTAEAARTAIVNAFGGGVSVDLHTVDYPDGEIGGTLSPFIPEPGTFLSAWLGLVGLAARARLRARGVRPRGRAASGSPSSSGRDR